MAALASDSDSAIDEDKLYVPGVAGLYELLAPLGYPLIRLALGLILVPHGFSKVFGTDAVHAARHFVDFGWPFPLAWGYFIGALEFFGGIMLALGLFTRVIAAAFFIEMMVISFAVLGPGWSWGHHGMEYTVFMGVVALGIFFRGAGRYSIDGLIGKEF